MFSFFKKKKADAPGKDAKPASKGTKAKADADKKPLEQKAAAPQAKETKPAQPPTSLREALAAMEEAIPGSATPAPPPKPALKVSAGANFDKAKDALAKKASQPMDREALIKQALAIQQTQAKMLDKLPEATRNKLRDMAMKAFVVDEPKTKDQKKKMN